MPLGRQGEPNAISKFLWSQPAKYWHQMWWKKGREGRERSRYVLSFLRRHKEMWGMQRAGIDLWSTSNFVLDPLQARPRQFLMLWLSHPAFLFPFSFFFFLTSSHFFSKCWQSDLEEVCWRRCSTNQSEIPLIQDALVSSGFKGHSQSS